MTADDASEEVDLLEVFSALARHGVDYAVFGAVALGLHGLARATADLDLFVAPDSANIERLKAALRSVFHDDAIEDMSAVELCGEYPAVRYAPSEAFSLDVVTRLGEAFSHADLEVEVKEYEGVPVRVVSARTLWRMKRDTVRPIDRMDAAALAERFGFTDEA